MLLCEPVDRPNLTKDIAYSDAKDWDRTMGGHHLGHRAPQPPKNVVVLGANNEARLLSSGCGDGEPQALGGCAEMSVLFHQEPGTDRIRQNHPSKRMTGLEGRGRIGLPGGGIRFMLR